MTCIDGLTEHTCFACGKRIKCGFYVHCFVTDRYFDMDCYCGPEPEPEEEE